MPYIPRSNTGSRLGVYAPQIEEKRLEEGLDENGRRLDGTDPAKGLKEAMEQEMYRRADEHMWFRDLLPRAPAEEATETGLRPEDL